MPTIPDFRLYHSNALDVLAGLLAEVLREPVLGQSILVPETIIIPQAAMRRWLQATLAGRYGIAANLQLLTPGEFVSRALDANLPLPPDTREDLSAAALHWRVYAALNDAELMQHPAMAKWRAYIESEPPDPLRSWALAGELAGIFEKYQAWRRDWLLAWEANPPAHDPQAILWQQIAANQQHRARRIDHYLACFTGAGQPLPQGLPRRLFVFATLNISPDVLRVISTQARTGTLHFYLPTPTRGDWGERFTKRHDGHHPLLHAWGAAGRDFIHVLGGYEVVHPRGEIEAFVEPEAHPQRLLQRLQGDVFHARPEPGSPLRDELDRHDPSLQFHACHTRLRELQVLYDQLCALLDDPRFDPPLEPRQIAVLAPDIDEYAPYLAAVFGRSGSEHHLPWTLADASPLQAEPVADLFLQLLSLPLSRFGLSEIMGLLASAPLQEVSGLDAAAFERLHGWLHAAGARWGLSAAHRRQHNVPEDDAYTWQFALDRLLLGHASGSEDEIAGIAPWPVLEGNALAALDTLIRLLRVLARYSQALNEAMPPAQWRERLLALLQALLPEVSAPATQRTLKRLYRLIDAFANDAARAGFEEPVPAGIVRAYFAAMLSEADTRAPLLTGGISFARMVPLRLLPFRVICILGMNDGDYPRRDPAAGLNRLANALNTPERRPGDRSIREDDRFLFLQLFSAAQEVFYLSYLGADPRDGSAREPSVLVRELIEAAAAQHTEPSAVRKHLTVRHPLQPFSPSAFGGDGDEPRRFSYQRQWYPAAGASRAERQPLLPWFHTPLADESVPEARLSQDTLRRFLTDPAGQFLRERLGWRPGGEIEASEDIEPLSVPHQGRGHRQLQQHILSELLQGHDPEHLYPYLRARALIPSGALGEQQCRVLVARTRPAFDAFTRWHDGQPLQSHTCEIEIDGTCVYGQIDNVHPQGLVRLFPGPGRLSATAAIRTGLDWLFVNAAGHHLPALQFCDNGEGDYGPHRLPALPVEQAQRALALLLQLRQQGAHAPLLFAPYTGWEIWNAKPEQREKTARAKWYGGDHVWGESSGEALQLAFRGADPFASEVGTRTFIHNSVLMFTALREGRVLA